MADAATKRGVLVYDGDITMASSQYLHNKVDRKSFIGGSDARTIMGTDEAALVRLWLEKRGEIGPEDPVEQPGCSARQRHRGAQQGLVRAQYGAPHYRRPAPREAFRHPMDGCDP